MGQTKTTDTRQVKDPDQVSFRMAKAVAPKAGQSWLDAAKETSTGVGMDITPGGTRTETYERDLNQQEKQAQVDALLASAQPQKQIRYR